MKFVALSVVCLLTCASSLMAKIRTEIVEYRIGAEVFQGYLSYDDADDRPRPGVLVCHEWWGCNDYARTRAEMLATLGYIAFALDMYGKDKTTTDREQAGKWAGGLFGDGKAMRERAAAGLKVLSEHRLTDKTRLAAIGYCMGGTVALELARSGADLKATVAFHASNLAASNAEDNRNIKGVVMVCHGADDGLVKPDEPAKFEAQMKAAKVSYLFIAYSGAKHAFTNPAADKANIPNVGYDAKADARSWKHMQSLFEEVFMPRR